MTLRCPVCRGHLSAADTIEGAWLEDEDAWIYRYACGSCLSIVSQRVEEISHERRRPGSDPPKVDIASGVVARVVEALEDASRRGALRDAVLDVQADEARRVLLRVPAIFRIARPAWTTVARLARAASYLEEGNDELVTRTQLIPEPPDAARSRVRHVDGMTFRRLESGTPLYLRAFDGETLIVTMSPGAELQTELIAQPDLVTPEPDD